MQNHRPHFLLDSSGHDWQLVDFIPIRETFGTLQWLNVSRYSTPCCFFSVPFLKILVFILMAGNVKKNHLVFNLQVPLVKKRNEIEPNSTQDSQGLNGVYRGLSRHGKRSFSSRIRKDVVRHDTL